MAANTSTATTTTATVDDPSAAADNIVTEYATYESYLDSQITQNDLFYLEVLWYMDFHSVINAPGNYSIIKTLVQYNVYIDAS